MRRKFERSSVPERLVRHWREVTSLVLAALVMLGCAPVQTEVGSGLPPSSEAGAADAPTGRCDALAPLRLYYRRSDVSSGVIDFLVKVENVTVAPVPIGSIKVRYYFTNELAPPTKFDVFYADTCCSDKKLGFEGDVHPSLQALPPTPNAAAFLEIAFADSVGPLAPGDAVQVELSFHDPDYVRESDQANDYSYSVASAGTQEQWNDCPGPQCDAKFTTCAITVYQNDAVVWGIAP
jgi:hypothetical protein